MESYEVELNRKIVPVKAVQNITGHNILRYKIHGDKQVPFVKTRTTQRMEEGDVFAIETFGSTGKAYLRDDVGIYGYGRNDGASAAGFHHASAKSLLKKIDENFGTLVFSRRYLERLGAKNYHLGMRTLVSNGIVESYGPLIDVPGSYVAQFEHVSVAYEQRTTQCADPIFCRPFYSGPIAKRSSLEGKITKEKLKYEVKLDLRMLAIFHYLCSCLQQSRRTPR